MDIQLPYARYEEIKEHVVDTFERFGVVRPPVDVFALAARMGIEVKPYSAYDKQVRPILMGTSPDGFLDWLEPGRGVIYYNDKHFAGRTNYTMLHEIGHFVLGHLEQSPLAEKEANFFAKFALAPPPWVHRSGLTTPGEIATAFGTSLEEANYAINYYRKWRCRGARDLTCYEKRLLGLRAAA